MERVYPIKIHPQSLTQLVKVGKYDIVGLDIYQTDIQDKMAERVKAQSGQTVKLVVAHFDWSSEYSVGIGLSSKEILKKLTSQRLRPANLLEILTFGARYPRPSFLPAHYRIGAIGTILTSVYGHSYALCISQCCDRYLELHFWEGTWHEGWDFLAVPSV